MNEINTENKVKSAEIAETDAFDKALASRDVIIAARNATIKELKDKLGKREQVISEQIENLNASEARRIEAESKIAEGKELKRNSKDYVIKSKEEKFLDDYAEACRKIRSGV
jgi:hypothetical protein